MHHVCCLLLQTAHSAALAVKCAASRYGVVCACKLRWRCITCRHEPLVMVIDPSMSTNDIAAMSRISANHALLVSACITTDNTIEAHVR
jgi:hypothetical protein